MQRGVLRDRGLVNDGRNSWLSVQRVAGLRKVGRVLAVHIGKELKERRPQNVAGEFYVDHTCIDCDTCRWMALCRQTSQELAPSLLSISSPAQKRSGSRLFRHYFHVRQTRSIRKHLLMIPKKFRKHFLSQSMSRESWAYTIVVSIQRNHLLLLPTSLFILRATY